MRLPRIVKSYPVSTLLFAACPVMAFVAFAFTILGQFTDSPSVTRIGVASLYMGMKLMLPIGVCCAVQSWRMAHADSSATDSHDIVEFVLGASAFVMIVLGAIFATY